MELHTDKKFSIKSLIEVVFMKNQIFLSIIIDTFRLLILVGLSSHTTLSAQDSDNKAFKFIISPYIQDVTDSTFTILWETSTPFEGAICLAKAEYTVLKPAMKMVASEPGPVRFHKLVVGGLEPDELYYYQVINRNNLGDTLKGPITSFTIPNYDQAAISFTVVGDTQGNPAVWERIAELMFRESPQFVIHCGDLVQYGPNKDDWVDEFFKPANHLLRHIPLYPAIGNHEMNDQQFYQYFELPGNDAFYSVKKGALRVIFVDTNKDILPGSQQYRKLERLLARSDERWKIVVHHHPVFTSDKSSYRSSMMAKPIKGDPNTLHLKDLYETYGVDFSLSGHIHGYERSWPVRKNHIDEDHGVVHIVAAGGGGRMRDASAYKNWFSVETKKMHHFLNLRIWRDRLRAEAIDTAGRVFDTWEKEKYPGRTNLKPPLVETPRRYFIDNTRIAVKNTNGTGAIHYRQNNGQYRSILSKEASLVVDRTTTVSAFVSNDQNDDSRSVVKTVIKIPLMKSQKSAVRAISADYYEGYFTLLPDFGQLKPTRTFSPDSLSLQDITPRAKDHFAVRFKGSFHIPDTDVYRFLLESFDGSMLLIDGKVIIDNDGVHYEIFREGYAALEQGAHFFEVRYFDFERRETLNLKIGKQDGAMVDFNRYIAGKAKK